VMCTLIMFESSFCC